MFCSDSAVTIEGSGSTGGGDVEADDNVDCSGEGALGGLPSLGLCAIEVSSDRYAGFALFQL